MIYDWIWRWLHMPLARLLVRLRLYRPMNRYG
jgi:hypothetical protein